MLKDEELTLHEVESKLLEKLWHIDSMNSSEYKQGYRKGIRDALDILSHLRH